MKLYSSMKVLLGLVLPTFICSSAQAEDTDISSIENTIYIESGLNLETDGEGNVVVPIQMKNSVEATGYEFRVILPEGIKATDVSMKRSADRKEENVSFSYEAQTDGSLKVVSYTSDDVAFEGNDGEVLTMTIANAKTGSFIFTIKDVVITYHGSTVKPNCDIASTVSVSEITYDPTCSIQILPFAFTEDVDGLEFTLTTSKALTDIEFDIEMPTEIGTNQLYTVAKSLGNTTATTSIDDDEAGKVNVAISRKTTKTIADGATVAKLEIGYDGEVLTTGVCQLKIKNVVLTDVDGNTHKAAPYSADIYVGTNPKASPQGGVVTFSGDYSDNELAALLMSSLPTEDASVTTLDLSGVTVLPANTTFTLANPNAIIYTKTDLGLTNTKNVVIGNVCDELSLEGDNNFAFKKNFTATEATYTRTVSNKYGTICLPYDVTAVEGYAFYTLDKVEDNVMYFDELQTLPAGTPAMIQVTSTGENSISANGVTVKPNANQQTATGFTGWTMEGSFTTKVIDVTKDADHSYFFISGDKYWQATETLTVKPFRAYFMAENSNEVKSYFISMGDETGMKTTLFDASEIESVYDVTGKQRSALDKGLNILKMNDGSVRKIIINK